jgi:hypothetical protein
MRIPFIHRKPEDVASIARRATRVGSAEVAGPRLRPDRTYAEALEARTRINARRNGSLPS